MTAKELLDTGIEFQRNGNMEQAKASYVRAISLWPQEIAPYSKLAELALLSGDEVTALEWTDKGLAVNENIIQLWNSRAVALLKLGRNEEAEGAFKRAIAIAPDNKDAINNLWRLYLMQKRYADAEAPLRRAAEISPNSSNIFNNLGVALKESHKYEEAEAAFNRAIDLTTRANSSHPESWEAYYNMGKMFIDQKRYPEAVSSLRRASEINSNSADIFCDLGYALHELFMYDEAYVAFDRALEIMPNHTQTILNKLTSLNFFHKFSDAEVQIRKALASLSNTTDATEAATEVKLHLILATLLMSQGNLTNGLEEYEWRWKAKDWQKIRQYPGRPLWTPDEKWIADSQLHGETVFVWYEQGLGDMIHFVRFIEELAKQDCQIIAEVQPELYRLLAASYSLPNLHFIRAREKPPSFDIHIPLMSLPRMLGVTYEKLPEFKSYLKQAESEIEFWRWSLNAKTLPENRKKRKIGIVWAGNPAHPEDRTRSMSWETISPLIDAHKHHFQFYSLQVGSQALAEYPGVINLGPSLTDFAVTAAIVTNLDLVIAVDTSVVHLAGALGKPVWTMLFNTPDWRWRMDKNGDGEKTTPWYPSMSLFWQKKAGVWDDVIDEVSEALRVL